MTSPFQTIMELAKEIKEREQLEVSREYTGHWSYDDILRAELSQANAFLEEIDKRIIEIKKENMTARRKESGTFQYVRNKAIRELEALKNSVQGTK